MKKVYEVWPPESLYYPFDLLLPLKRGNPFSGYSVRGNEAYHPFFIVGSPRSGNTLMRRILYAHPYLHIPPEVFVLGRTIRLFRQYRNMNWGDLVRFILAQYEFAPEFETFEISLRQLAEKLVGAPTSSRNLAFILDNLYRYHAEMKGKKTECKRWGDKTPLNIFIINTILSVFPDAQFICMIRDGVDAIVSTIEANIHPDFESSAKRWLAAMKAIKNLKRRYPNICLEVRYETLVQQPEEITVKVCDFLGVEPDAGLINSMVHSHTIAQQMTDVRIRTNHANVRYPISTTSIGKGRQKLSMIQKQRLQELIGPELKGLGYEPATA
jgi:protein-tyrosine sulfotransferase